MYKKNNIRGLTLRVYARPINRIWIFLLSQAKLECIDST